MMSFTRRRALVAAAGTLAIAAAVRKLLAAGPGEAASGIASWHIARHATPVPDIHFTTADGGPRTLADYAGQGVVLNLWATWCVPCVAEMPALDALARVVAGDRIVVLPLSSDRGGAAAVEAFYRQHGIASLPVLLDSGSTAAHLLGSRGIPTTLIIDRAGQEQGRLEGAAPWSDAATIAMVRKLVS